MIAPRRLGKIFRRIRNLLPNSEHYWPTSFPRSIVWADDPLNVSNQSLGHVWALRKGGALSTQQKNSSFHSRKFQVENGTAFFVIAKKVDNPGIEWFKFRNFFVEYNFSRSKVMTSEPRTSIGSLVPFSKRV